MVEARGKHPEASLISSRFEICDEQMNLLAVSRLLVLKEGESYLEHRDYCPEHFVIRCIKSYQLAWFKECTLLKRQRGK